MKESTKQSFYDATKELPVVNATENKDTRQKIYKWGEDNFYPNYLASLGYSCAIHGGIISSKVHYTVSEGLNYLGADKEAWERFFKNGNSDFNLDEISEPISNDLENFNAFALLIHFVDGFPFQQDHVPFEKLRKGLNGNWVYSEDWSDRRFKQSEIPTLDLSNRTGKQLIVFMIKPKQILIGRKLTHSIYPVPVYSGGILAIETDIEINNYRRNEIYNNFSLGTIINLNNGKPQLQKDEDKILDEISATSQGSSNAGGVWVSFNNGKDKEATVVNLTGNNLDQRYTVLSKDNKENILQAHAVTTPMIFGVKTEGQLGGATEVETLYNLMKSGYFKKRQNNIAGIFEFIFNKLLGKGGDIVFNEVNLDIVKEESKFNFNFSKEQDPLINMFSGIGKPKQKNKILMSREANINDFAEEDYLKQYKTFASVTDMQLNVLSLIREGNTFDQIKGVINITPSNLSKIYSNLQDNGYLSGEEVSEKGIKVLAANDKIKLSVVYSYEVRPELNQPEIISGTRDFCRGLLELDRVYTREEITQLSAVAMANGLVERDVWTYRGGWYHNPNTDRNNPACRHFWQQNIILE